MTYFTPILVNGQPRLQPTPKLLEPLSIDDAVALSDELTRAVRQVCELREAYERARNAGEE